MLSNNTKIGLILGLVLVVILSIWFLDGSGNNKLVKTYQSDNWTKKYNLQDRDPYGLYVFNELLEKHIDKKHSVKSIYSWAEHDSLFNKKEKVTYMFIGENFELLDNEMDSLLKKVEDGSDLMICFYDLTTNLYDRFFHYVNFEFDYSDSVMVYTPTNNYTFYSNFQTDTVAYSWEAFDEYTIKDTVYQTLSSFMEMPNFIKLSRGKGSIYLHANPYMYYNCQLLTKDGFRYANYTINQLPKNQNVCWLEIGRQRVPIMNEQQNQGKKQSNDSLLQLFFKNSALRWALMVTVLGLILFLIFRTKRMKPVVPIILPKRNVTVAYAETITSIYYQNHSPFGILKVQRKNFYQAINKHFYIDLTKRNEDKEIQLLSEKSNVSVAELNELLQLLENKNSFEITEQYIAKASKMQREFYLKTGIISKYILQRIENKDLKFRRVLWIPFLFLVAGAIAFVMGFYFLMKANGFGIVFWPLGILMLIIAILQLKKPLLEISNKELVFYVLFGKPVSFQLEELVDSSLDKKGAVLNFPNNRNLSINFWKMSQFDRHAFSEYMLNLRKKE